MGAKEFRLSTEIPGPMAAVAAPTRLRLPLCGHTILCETGDEIAACQTVAKATDGETGDLHAPFAGVIAEVAADHIVLDVRQGETAEPLDFSTTTTDSLKEALRKAGVDVGRLVQAKTLIVNATPPEPGTLVQGQLLRDCRSPLSHGLEAIKRIVGPTSVDVAGIDVEASFFGNCTIHHVPATYPAGLNPMVTQTITGQENPDDMAVVSVLDLYAIGRVLDTNQPFTTTVLTVAGQNVLAPVGMSARDLLAAVSVEAAKGDRVILGGPLRGTALHDLDIGIGKYDLALTHTAKDSYPPVTDTMCMNCGRCVRACPARIQPGLIARAAEFKLFDRAREYGVDVCFECGICGFYCTARRPLLQYIRLAKQELAALDAARALMEETEPAQEA